MVGIIGIIAALTVLGLSLVITRIATVALVHTGLSWEAARFQARSAFTGTGFTTSETEKVVSHPVRRRIIMLLMIARSAGLLSIIISLILSFAGGGEMSRMYRLLWLTGGVVVLWVLARSGYVDRYLRRIIEWALSRWTDLDVRDYAGLLKLSGEYTVEELRVNEGDWLAGKSLRNCRLNDEGVTVLGVYRSDGSYVGAPKADTKIYPEDTVILYGRDKTLHNIDARRANQAGEAAHDDAVTEQKRHEEEEGRREQQYEAERRKKSG